MTKSSKISSKINSNISKLSSHKYKDVIIIILIIVIIVILYLIISTCVLDKNTNGKDPFDALSIDNTYYSILNPPESSRRVSSHFDLQNAACRTKSYNGVLGSIPSDYLSPDKPPFTGYPEKGYYDNQNPETLKCIPGYDCISSMLDTPEGWHAFNNESILNKSVNKEWLQMDLGSIMTVSGVITQARGLGFKNNQNFSQIVTKYTVQCSSDTPPSEPPPEKWYPSKWTKVDKDNVFDGNIAADSIKNPNKKVGKLFAQPIQARFIRIYPQAYTGHISMRAAVLIPNSVTITINNTKTVYPITNDTINVNNTMYAVLNPPDNDIYRQRSTTLGTSPLYNHTLSMLDSPQGWSVTTNDNKQWLQFSLDANTVIAGVVTQSRGIGFPGAGDASNQMVIQYQVQYSTDNKTWKYVDDDNTKQFVGNSAVDDKIGNLFLNLIVSRYIRILPTNYSNYTSMRAGLIILKGEPIIVNGVVSVIKK